MRGCPQAFMMPAPVVLFGRTRESLPVCGSSLLTRRVPPRTIGAQAGGQGVMGGGHRC